MNIKLFLLGFTLIVWGILLFSIIELFGLLYGVIFAIGTFSVDLLIDAVRRK